MDIKLHGFAVINCLFLLSVPISGIPDDYFSDSRFDGLCPNVPVMQNFSRQQFYGNWYEISRIEHELQRSTDCVTLEFEKVLNGIATIQFESQFLSNDSDLNRNGIAFVSRPVDNQGEFNVIWEADLESNYEDQVQRFGFRIIETDYTGYAIMYDCNQFNATVGSGKLTYFLLDVSNQINQNYLHFFWVLSRNRELATDAQTRVNAFREQWNIATGVRDTDQRASVCNSSGKLLMSWLLVIAAIGLIKFM